MNEFYVYLFEHIDVSSFIMPVEKFFELHPEYQFDEYLEGVKEKFMRAGWEGDGKIGIIWIPPFMTGSEDCVGNFVFHVKQATNGTSFLASEYMLPEFCKRYVPSESKELPSDQKNEISKFSLN